MEQLQEKKQKLTQRFLRLLGKTSAPYGHLTSPFFRLPAELRLQIYSYVIGTQPLVPWGKKQFLDSYHGKYISRAESLHFLRTCKAIHLEAQDIVYAQRPLRIVVGQTLRRALTWSLDHVSEKRYSETIARFQNGLSNFRNLYVAVDFLEEPRERNGHAIDHTVEHLRMLKRAIAKWAAIDEPAKRSLTLHVDLSDYWQMSPYGGWARRGRSWRDYDTPYKYSQVRRFLQHLVAQQAGAAILGCNFDLAIDVTDYFGCRFLVVNPTMGDTADVLVEVEPNPAVRSGLQGPLRVLKAGADLLRDAFGDGSSSDVVRELNDGLGTVSAPFPLRERTLMRWSTLRKLLADE